MIDKYKLPDFPYSYESFEPYLDKETMFLHYTQHHQNYLNNIKKILENTKYYEMDIHYILNNFHNIEISNKISLLNNIGGHLNHVFFWKILKIGIEIPNILKSELIKNFGSIELFKKDFEKLAVQHFGSGWIWLIKNKKYLKIVTTVNQENPAFCGKKLEFLGTPIFGVDLWEHAYYLKYKNRRLEYLKSFWNVVNWNYVNNLFLSC